MVRSVYISTVPTIIKTHVRSETASLDVIGCHYKHHLAITIIVIAPGNDLIRGT